MAAQLTAGRRVISAVSRCEVAYGRFVCAGQHSCFVVGAASSAVDSEKNLCYNLFDNN